MTDSSRITAPGRADLSRRLFVSPPLIDEIISLLKLSLRRATSKRDEHVAENDYRSSHVGGSWLGPSFDAHRGLVAL
jgi:hypothetical protein